jgi:regulator of protease activity HflC (stomatin/prohibitin superfamily)
MSSTKIFIIASTVIVSILLLFIGSSLVVNLESDKVMVIQSLGGDLTCYTKPGWQLQWLGHVTKYPRQESYDFLKEKSGTDNSKKLRFNDGGHADLSGSVNWLMPSDCKSIIAIQQNFGSPEGVISKGISKMVDGAIFMSGPLMSSTESSAERRAELVQYINDQAQNGTYVTTTETITAPDPITGEKKPIMLVKIAHDDKGNPKRQQGSILDEYGIKLQPVSIRAIDYDGVVEKQIAQRQEATTQVQISKAAALRAEQEAITAAKQGEANAAKAKWEQETDKAKAVVKAQQNLEVATLDAKAAEQYKREQILRGEGDGERRRLVMQADGALDKKLETWLKGQELWANAFKDHQGALVPSIMMGGGSGGSNAAFTAQNMMELIGINQAKQLAVNLDASGADQTTSRPTKKEAKK